MTSNRPSIFAALLLAPLAPLAAQESCTAVFDAMTKVINTPSHVYNNSKPAGGPARTSETIYAGGAIFTKVRDSWKRSSMTPQQMLKQEEENRRNSKYSCRRIQDESVNGEAAAVYSAHAETEDTKSETRIWISKSKGLPLRQELDIDAGGAKTHYSVRYEFGNVKAPLP